MALGVSRATYYGRRRSQNAAPYKRRSPRALTQTERTAVLAVLHEPRFVDLAPAEVYATLLDEGDTSTKRPKSRIYTNLMTPLTEARPPGRRTR
jgi:hypothetical protein